MFRLGLGLGLGSQFETRSVGRRSSIEDTSSLTVRCTV